MPEDSFPLEGARLVYDLPAREYHSGPELSASAIGPLMRSPAHFQYSPRIASNAMRKGTLFHVSALEPEKAESLVVKLPDGNWRTKDYKAEARAFLAGRGVDLPEEFKRDDAMRAIDDAGMVMASDSEALTSIDMAASIRNSPVGKQLFADPAGRAEVSIFFQQEVETSEDPVLLRCRPDFLVPSRAIVDLKKTINASPDHFARSVFNFGYHLQAHLYRLGVYCATGEWLPFVIGACEEAPPHCCAWYVISDEFLAIGETEFHAAINLFARCLSDHIWPGYPQEILDILPPSWAKPRISDD